MAELVPGTPAYPPALLDLPDPPVPLYVRGRLGLDAPRVAIVGARRASERGRRLAESLAFDLARRGVIVVSGGALGIDGAAHRGAVEAGRPTWVVLPSPLSSPVPRTQRRLFDRVLEAGGAWLSELGSARGKVDFFSRNRLVAALGHATVVVEARLRSGTRHTVEAAGRLGRPLGVFPWAVGEPGGEGCLAWLEAGAAPVTGAASVVAMLEAAGRSVPEVAASAPAAARGLGGRVLEALGSDGARPEAVAARLGCPLADVLVELTALELRGLIQARPGGAFAARGVAGGGR